MIETHHLKNVIFFQTILSFALSRKVINNIYFPKIMKDHKKVRGSTSFDKIKKA